MEARYGWKACHRPGAIGNSLVSRRRPTRCSPGVRGWLPGTGRAGMKTALTVTNTIDRASPSWGAVEKPMRRQSRHRIEGCRWREQAKSYSIEESVYGNETLPADLAWGFSCLS